VKSRFLTAALLLIFALCLSFGCAAAEPGEVQNAAAFDTFFETYSTVFDDDVAEFLDGQKSNLLEKLSEKLKDFDPGQLSEDLSALLQASSGMTDEELSSAILAAAENRGISLKESQVQQLVDLCRSLEKLDGEELREKIDGLRNFSDNLGEAKGFFVGFFAALRTVFIRIGEAIRSLFAARF